MIAADPLLWLRDALRERADVRSADIDVEPGGVVIVVLTDGTRLHARAKHGTAFSFSGPTYYPGEL
jgi:hypothetical protein